MKLTLDVENVGQKRDGKLHLDPFEPDNSLTMVGMLTDRGLERLITFDHQDVEATPNGHEQVQEWLDEATVLIMHNASHDLLWLWESGFNYNGPVFDTMLTEYVLQRGQKNGSLGLEACAMRYELDTKKQDSLKEHLSKGGTTYNMNHAVLSQYLSADLHATQQLADKLMYRLNTKADAGLLPTVNLTNEVAVSLSRMYQRGFAVDLSKLDEVRKEYEQEKRELIDSLQKHVHKLMGDTPINLNSPEQLSWVIYSRKVMDKQFWGNAIEPYMSNEDFVNLVSVGTRRMYKTRAEHCTDCNGTGYVRKVKKDGTPFARPNGCKTCNSLGYNLVNLDEVAGLKFKPPSSKWASANGFSTSKDNLSLLQASAKSKGMVDAVDFLSKVSRLSAVDTYLSSFVEGISTHTKPDGKLHVRLLQHRTATGRFSGADPNMQNMPRGGTFPVKRVFVSRWDGGKILEADMAQLEFRTAAFLSQDGVAIEEVKTGFDVHSYTAKVISDAGQNTSRQDAKAHTFAPLYGATGYGRTPAEAEYYQHFTEKYKGVGLWHTRLAKEAVNTNLIKTPSGREFSFPDVTRRRNGTVTFFTQIKNYPVQSFATADIVPICLLHIDKLLDTMQSCVVNSVHDSIVIDVHPDEERRVLNIIKQTNDELPNLITLRWGIDFNVPLLLESKIGYNWLDTKDVI
jgi:DNA polymerase I-like protein with 3'-5' exonuclease and polymerase domains